MPVAPAPSETELAERLAARTLELIDIPSESRSEAALAAYVASVQLRGAVVEDLGDSCVLAYPRETRPRVLLAGHLDTVPAQGNIPGRVDGRARLRARRVGHEGRAGGDDGARARAGAVRGAVLPARGAAVVGERADAAARALAGRRRVRGRDGADERRAARRLRRATSTRRGRSGAAPGTRRGRGTPTTRSTARRRASSVLAARRAGAGRVRRPHVHRGGVGDARSRAGSR